MNFDYEYTTMPEEIIEKSEGITWWMIVIIAVAALIVIAAFVFLIIHLKNKPKKTVKIKGKMMYDGVVFCARCNNEYDVILKKCPYCKLKRNGRLK